MCKAWDNTHEKYILTYLQVLAIDFVPLANEIVPLAIEFVALAFEFIALAQKFIRNKIGSWSEHENKM